jgi:iron complex transport system substrate-binding protein
MAARPTTLAPVTRRHWSRRLGHVALRTGDLATRRDSLRSTVYSGHRSDQRVTSEPGATTVSRRLVLVVLVLANIVIAQAQFATAQEVPRRIVSLVPALTEMLFSIGAGPEVVAVSSYDEWPPEVLELPRVGALLDPDTELILALDPDLVITYGSQTELEGQFARAGIQVFSYRHAGLAGVLRAMRELGEVAGHQAGAERAIRDIEIRLDAIRRAVAGRERPRTLLVFARQPLELRQIYASGGTGFLHDILVVAGGENVFADIDRESTQPSLETVLVEAPDVVLEVRPTDAPDITRRRAERAVWNTLGSVPAVRNDRVELLFGGYLVVPGPRVTEIAETIARVLHPDAF